MEIVLIRHAEPRWIDAAGQPSADPPLSERGVAQARSLAGELHARGWGGAGTELLISPMRRTRATAAPIIERLGLAGAQASWLREIQLPPLEGLSAAAVSALLSEARSRPPEIWWDGLEGGERYGDFEGRVRAGLFAHLAERGLVPAATPPGCFWQEEAADERRRLLLVAHGGTNSALLGALLALPPVPWSWERFVLHHASICVLRTGAVAGHRLFGLRALNDIHHIPAADRTR